MDLVIRNVTVVDPQGLRENVDIGIEKGKIAKIGTLGLMQGPRELDGTGLHAFPAFADMHCHLTSSAYTMKADIQPGAARAAAGGYTDICLMPNTEPPVDSVALVEDVLRLSEDAACRVHPIACVTRDMRGEHLTHFSKLLKAGAIAFSDNGHPIDSMELMLAAMKDSFVDGALVMIREQKAFSRIGNTERDGRHEEEEKIAGVGIESEENMMSRDVFTAEQQGGRVHFCDIATSLEVGMMRSAKQKHMINISSGTSPMYYASAAAGILGRDKALTAGTTHEGHQDKMAVVKGLMDGTIDCITTDPIFELSPSQQADNSSAGLGFEDAFALATTYLYQPGLLSLPRVATLMSTNPRRILGLPGGRVEPGEVADIAICDVSSTYRYEGNGAAAPTSDLKDGMKLIGRVIWTIRDGNIIYDGSVR